MHLHLLTAPQANYLSWRMSDSTGRSNRHGVFQHRNGVPRRVDRLHLQALGNAVRHRFGIRGNDRHALLRSSVKMRFVHRLPVILTLAFAFLAAPLGALCSSCCPEPETGGRFSAPRPCCGDSCGPSITAARPHGPALTSSKTRLDPPHSAGVPQRRALEVLVATGSFLATIPAAPTESPPVSSSVLRL